jgi:hypothetical protein
MPHLSAMVLRPRIHWYWLAALLVAGSLQRLPAAPIPAATNPAPSTAPSPSPGVAPAATGVQSTSAKAPESGTQAAPNPAGTASTPDESGSGPNAKGTAGPGSDAPPDSSAPGAPANPYKGIIATRNVFGIRPPAPPPPEPPPQPEAPKTPPPNVFLTGFSSWKGVKKVYLQVTPPGAKFPSYLAMRVGEEQSVGDNQSEIKILEIDEREETAKIVNGGQEFTLNFKENGLKATGAPQPPGGVPGPNNNPNGINTPRMAGPPGGGGSTFIGRGGAAPNPPMNTSLPAPNSQGASGLTEGNAGPITAVSRDIPSRRTGTTGGTSPNLTPVSPTEPRIINGRVIPPPPPLPVDPSTLPGN